MTTPSNTREIGRTVRTWTGWLLVATAWWTLDGITDVMNYRVIMPSGGADMQRIWRAYMLSAWLWVPLSLLALWLSTRFPLSAGNWRRTLGVHAAGAAVACIARAVAVMLLNPWVGWYPTAPSFNGLLVTSLANNFFPYWMLVGVGHAVVYARRIRDRDAQLARAELHALKLQLKPHFLFNALNTINTYVRVDQEVAQRMISRLSDLLRRVLDNEGVEEVTFEEELALVRSYLDIEQVRFADRLRVEWRIDADTRAASVPHLILQPLVENSIRHGIEPRAREGTVEIRAFRSASSLCVSVRDDGVGLRGAGPSSGRGLANTRNRLRQLYGDLQRVDVTAPETGGYLIELWMPFRLRPAAAP